MIDYLLVSGGLIRFHRFTEVHTELHVGLYRCQLGRRLPDTKIEAGARHC